jgi:hypothetical protein
MVEALEDDQGLLAPDGPFARGVSMATVWRRMATWGAAPNALNNLVDIALDVGVSGRRTVCADRDARRAAT